MKRDARTTKPHRSHADNARSEEFVGLLGGLFVGLLSGQFVGQVSELGFGQVAKLVAGLGFGVVGGLFVGQLVGQVVGRVGLLHRVLNDRLYFRLGFGLGFGLGSVLFVGLSIGLIFGLGGVLFLGLGVDIGFEIGVGPGYSWRIRIRRFAESRRESALPAPDDRRPPQFAEYLLYFLPKTTREPLLGDLEEEYREIYVKFGKRRATIWYYVQVGLSFYPLAASGAKRLIRWGVLGWIGGVVRRLIS